MEPQKEDVIEGTLSERVQKVVENYDQWMKGLNPNEMVQQKPIAQVDTAVRILTEVAKEVPEQTGRVLDEVKGRIDFLKGREPGAK